MLRACVPLVKEIPLQFPFVRLRFSPCWQSEAGGPVPVGPVEGSATARPTAALLDLAEAHSTLMSAVPFITDCLLHS